MRKLFLFCFLLLTGYCFNQQGTTTTDSMMHDGIIRSYITYVPPSYSPTSAAPLVLNFHGLGSNAIQQYYYGDFRGIADTAGFIVVHPEGTVYQGNSHWNVIGPSIGSSVDDLGFTDALLDKLLNEYNIDATRIYSTGMSNGGYMSFHLACQLSNRIAAVASVTGSMTPYTYNSCNPLHSTPIMQIHGTMDSTVPYNGDIWTKSIDEVIGYWSNFNNCNTNPNINVIPNTNLIDQSTVEHYVYNNGDNGSTVEHYKVIGGEHTWPGSIVSIGITNYDFNASIEIWRFFSQYNLNTLAYSKGLNENHIKLTPNPFNRSFVISSSQPMFGHYFLIDGTGKKMLSGKSDGTYQITINGEKLNTGLYYFILKSNNNGILSQKLIKQ
tara:strand:- start:214 stop:1359 length:1146 start_codon:yes stop_codon:yes gene_type:complete